MRAALRRVEPGEAARAGREAARRILELAELAAAPRVALYAALADELPSRDLFDALRRRGTPTLFPRCLDDGRLAFAAVRRWEDLVPGRYGLAEPREGAVALEVADVVVVPGLAFDAQGRRLGRGGGYYDRTFPPGGTAPFLVGAGFAFQRVAEVPAGPDDRAMDAVVTDRETRRVARAPGRGDRP